MLIAGNERVAEHPLYERVAIAYFQEATRKRIGSGKRKVRGASSQELE